MIPNSMSNLSQAVGVMRTDGADPIPIEGKVGGVEVPINTDALETLLAGGLPAALDAGALKTKEQSPLTGFATSSKQDAIITALQKIDDLQAALNSVATDKLLAKIYSGGEAIPVGKIPDAAAQIAVSTVADNSQPLLRRVTSGKTLYITALTISVLNQSGGNAQGQIMVNDAGDSTLYSIIVMNAANGTTNFATIQLTTPIEAPSLYYIRLKSNAANCYVYGFLHGYEL